MARKKDPADKPDAITSKDEDGLWRITCLLCPRTLGQSFVDRHLAYHKAGGHLEHSHGLTRIWIDEHPFGYRKMVQDAIPGIVAHNLQTIDHVRPR